MTWHLTADVERYLRAAGDYLQARAAENTVLLTVAENVRVHGAGAYGGGPALFGWWSGPDGTTGGAFMHTPPYPVGLSRVAAGAAAALAGTLADAGRSPGGVNGSPETARAFAAAWQARTGCEVTVHRRMRQYRLAGLTPPDPPPPGAPRTAVDADRDLLVRWLTAFAVDVNDPPGDPARLVGERLSHGGLTLWEDGQPVSLAGRTPQVAGQVRVGPVFTPAELRGRGFAGAVTAAVSQAALATGAEEVLLYTDLDNPTSNALYQRLGYRPTGDHLSLLFHPDQAGEAAV